MADNNKLSQVLTQAQVDAQAVYAAAASVNPYQAALIKKNAQGNIMSAGVLESLSALNVNAQSGVGTSIAEIDAATRAARLADQRDIAQKKATKEFNDSNKGKLWSAVKGVSRGLLTAYGTPYEFVNATYRTTLGEIQKRGVVAGIASGLGINPAMSIDEKMAVNEQIMNQTKISQIVVGAVKSKSLKFDTGEGFSISEEIGLGHVARQASLSAAKVAVRNSKGTVIGYQPRSLIGDTAVTAAWWVDPESSNGQVLSLVADIGGSFLFDPGIAKAQKAKQLRLLAKQERAKGAMDVAATLEQQAAKIDEAATAAMDASTGVRAAADNLKKIKLDEATAARDSARAMWTGKAEDAINAESGVKVSRARLDEHLVVKTTVQNQIADQSAALKELTAIAKSPSTIARTESALAKQTKIFEEAKSGAAQALANGKVPMYDEESLATLSAAVEATKAKLAAARDVLARGTVPSAEALLAAKEALKASKNTLKEVNGSIPFVEKQLAERVRNAKITARARDIASSDTIKKIKREKLVTEKLSDATISLKDKKTIQRLAIEDLANISSSAERPGMAYEAIANFLTNGHGVAAVDKLVSLTDWKEIWRKAGGKIDETTARALAEANTPDDVVDIIAPYLKRGDIQQGVLEPGRLSRMGEKITQRVPYGVPTTKFLQGVGARVQTRMIEHEKTTALFEGFYTGLKENAGLITKPLKRGYNTKIKSGTIVNIADKEELLRNAEDFGVAAKLPQDVLDNIIDGIANAASPAVAGKIASVDLMKAVFAHHGEKIPPHMQETFKKYTTAFEASAEQMSSYWASRHIAGAELNYMTLKGESVLLPGPHMQSELLNSTVYFPPVGELLRLTSKLSNYRTLAKGTELADIAIGGFWKKTQLVRPAYIIRNIAEEQIRVFGTGHISFFNNPGMAFAMWMGREEGSTLRKILHQFDTYRNTAFGNDFSTGDDALDILNETLGHDMKTSFVDMMNADTRGSFDERGMKVLQFKNVGAVAFGHKRFFDGVANALRMLNSDDIARVVAGENPKWIKDAMDKGAFRQDAVVDYFLNGPGRTTLNRFAESAPDDFKAFVKTPDGLKKYLYTAVDSQSGKDISVIARITEATGGNKALMEMVAYGTTKVAGKSVSIPRAVESAANSVSNAKAMRSGKKALLELQEEFAKELKFTFGKAGNWDSVLMNVPSRNLAHVESNKDKFTFVDWFFEKATEFEKNSTFGPEFRQAYWDAINEIAKSLNADAKAALLKTAEGSLTTLQRAGKPIGSKHPVWNAFKASKGDGPLSIEEAHAYADTYARKHVKGLFYNAQEKRLIFHQLRLVAPFASAWEDTIKKWSEIGLDNPYQVYKGIKTLDWLQKPESSAIYQITDAQDYYNPNQGFFFNNPESKERQFFVPFAGTVMAKIASVATGVSVPGAPMTFSANPASFNFALGAGSILPGVGPGVTIPISALGTFNNSFIDNMPEGVRKWLFPFGPSDFSSGLQSAILPANWNKIIGGITGVEATYSANFKPVMNYLAGGGAYNLDNPEDQAQLVKDTDAFARWNSIMRGVVGLFSPVGLIQTGLAKDKDGDVTLQTTVYNDFQQILINNDGDYNKAWYDFLNLYGASNAFAIISSSTGNGPSNRESYDFVVQNPDVASKYSDVWAYVMPGGGLSNEMYKWNLVHGTKVKLSPKEILDKVNSQRYYATRDALMTKVDAGELDKTGYSTALQYLKDAMGGGPVTEFDPNKRGRVVSQLEVLVQDERFADIPSIVALRDYMALRATSLEALGKKKFTGAASEQGERDWLAAQAEWVIKANPDFQKMFYAFFANELEGK